VSCEHISCIKIFVSWPEQIWQMFKKKLSEWSMLPAEVEVTHVYGNVFFYPKMKFTLSLGFQKGRPSYRRSFQPSKENIRHFKTWNYWTFSIFVGIFCPPGSGSRSTDLTESGSITDPQLAVTCNFEWQYYLPIMIRSAPLFSRNRSRFDYFHVEKALIPELKEESRKYVGQKVKWHPHKA
jgi:hypothetical protein